MYKTLYLIFIVFSLHRNYFFFCMPVFWGFFRLYLFTFREKVKKGEREGEKHGLVVSHTPRTGDLAGHPATCPDGESNW